MLLFHKNWQQLFPDKHLEVLLINNDTKEKYIADIFINNETF
jgi:hypothetical protein